MKVPTYSHQEWVCYLIQPDGQLSWIVEITQEKLRKRLLNNKIVVHIFFSSYVVVPFQLGSFKNTIKIHFLLKNLLFSLQINYLLCNGELNERDNQRLGGGGWGSNVASFYSFWGFDVVGFIFVLRGQTPISQGDRALLKPPAFIADRFFSNWDDKFYNYTFFWE